MEYVHQEIYKGYRIRIQQDDSEFNPYEDWDMFGTMYHWHKRGFFGEDYSRKQEELKELLDGILKDGGVVVPVWLYEYGGQTAGDNSYETMGIDRMKRKPNYPGDTARGGFCKTERKPYDIAVTAVLCYLATVTRREDQATHEPIMGSESHFVRSDGDGSDFLAGLDLARKALPQYSNMLDIPMSIMQDDRWCAPWIRSPNGYDARFCVDGYGYIHKKSTDEWYCFKSHREFAEFLEQHKRASFPGGVIRLNWGDYGPTEPDIWSASGSFDERRHARIGRAQTKVFSPLFPVAPDHAQRPPAFVRPGEMLANGGREFAYHIRELLAQKVV
jgi:hypothetical protein